MDVILDNGVRGRRNGRLRLVVRACLLAGMITSTGCVHRDNAAREADGLARGAPPSRWDVLLNADSQLRKGMSQEQVAAITGWPDNEDRKHVWVWVSSPQNKMTQRRNGEWMNLYYANAPNGGDLFLYFDGNGQLASGMSPGVMASPWQAYRGIDGLRTQEQIEARLGREKHPWTAPAD